MGGRVKPIWEFFPYFSFFLYDGSPYLPENNSFKAGKTDTLFNANTYATWHAPSSIEHFKWRLLFLHLLHSFLHNYVYLELGKMSQVLAPYHFVGQDLHIAFIAFHVFPEYFHQDMRCHQILLLQFLMMIPDENSLPDKDAG